VNLQHLQAMQQPSSTSLFKVLHTRHQNQQYAVHEEAQLLHLGWNVKLRCLLFTGFCEPHISTANTTEHRPTGYL